MNEALLLDTHIALWLDSGDDQLKPETRERVQPVPLSHGTAVRAYQLHHLEHRDPGDRLLIACAIDLGCPFVTYDARIRQFGRSRGKEYGFTLAG